MKKFMSLMLGLSLLTGAAAFAQNTNTTKNTTKKSGKKKTKKAKKTSADKMK